MIEINEVSNTGVNSPEKPSSKKKIKLDGKAQTSWILQKAVQNAIILRVRRLP